MSMLRREQTVCTRGVAALAVLAAVTLAGCATGEKARREAEMAALVKQVEELKKRQDQMTSFRAEEHGQAVLEFTELIDKFPKHALAATSQYWIGEAYYRQRDFNQALTEFQKVPDLYPQSQSVAESLLKIGLCYRALHDVPRARETWEQVVRSHPKSEAATHARALLASLGAPRRTPR